MKKASMRTHTSLPRVFLLLLTCVLCSAAHAAGKSDCLIQPHRVGPVKSNMTMKQAHTALQKAGMKITNVSPGSDFGASFDVADAKGILFTAILDTNYLDSETIVDESKSVVISFRVSSPRCRTPQGLHSGMTVKKIARYYGRPSLVHSEVFGMNFVEFSREPAYAGFWVAENDACPFNEKRNEQNETESYDAACLLRATVSDFVVN
jgi:hypothetical protein